MADKRSAVGSAVDSAAHSSAMAAEPSPFHEGERALQERLGVGTQLEKIGRRTIRDHLPEQHRAFYPLLPFILTGTMDETGQPWASILTGPTGFVSAPDPRRLKVQAMPLRGDPLEETLETGKAIGVLGLQLETRRRNRANGRVEHLSATGFDIAIDQSFGNCPQYIQTRQVQPLPAVSDEPEDAVLETRSALDGAAAASLSKADTFFIATAHPDGGLGRSSGVDVSHRGGKPGFIKVEDDGRLLIPDFAGNLYFNTLGNILLNPKVGLFLPDFESGERLYLSAQAEILFEDTKLAAFAGAERLLCLTITGLKRVTRGMPFHFTFGDFSPALKKTGNWS